MTGGEIASRLEDQQDAASDIALLCAAIGRESVTGNESNFAKFLDSTWPI
jgi:hypothetical protein